MLQRKVLLLNASNMDSFPVYPYAFIQVTAVARRNNIEVICHDLLGEAQEEWVQIIRGLHKRHQPAMILITLRNTDSMNYHDYRQDGGYVTDIYMIISELNPEGNAFILHLADMIRTFNAQQPTGRKVSWFGANYLLTFNRDDYQRLFASGFTGGWFDITALDDENARAMRTPYRNETLADRLQSYAQIERAEAKALVRGREENHKVRWTMFLGNPATTMETIRRTLAVANDAGLDTSFDSAYIVRPIRVFDYEKLSSDTLAVTFSVNDQLQRVSYQQILPSFAYPPALLNHLGSEEAIEKMFVYHSNVLLLPAYKPLFVLDS